MSQQHKPIFTHYDSGRPSAGRSASNIAAMIKKTEINLIGFEKNNNSSSPFSGYSLSPSDMTNSMIGLNSQVKYITLPELEVREREAFKKTKDLLDNEFIRNSELIKQDLKEYLNEYIKKETSTEKENINYLMEELRKEKESRREILKNVQGIETFVRTINSIVISHEESIKAFGINMSNLNSGRQTQSEANPSDNDLTDAKFSILEDHINDLRSFVLPLKETLSKEISNTVTGKIVPEIELLNIKLKEQSGKFSSINEELAQRIDTRLQDQDNEMVNLKNFTLSNKTELETKLIELEENLKLIGKTQASVQTKNNQGTNYDFNPEVETKLAKLEIESDTNKSLSQALQKKVDEILLKIPAITSGFEIESRVKEIEFNIKKYGEEVAKIREEIKEINTKKNAWPEYTNMSRYDTKTEEKKYIDQLLGAPTANEAAKRNTPLRDAETPERSNLVKNEAETKMFTSPLNGPEQRSDFQVFEPSALDAALERKKNNITFDDFQKKFEKKNLEEDPVFKKKASSGGARFNDVFAGGNEDIVTSVLRTSIDDIFVSTTSHIHNTSVDPLKRESIDDIKINYRMNIPDLNKINESQLDKVLNTQESIEVELGADTDSLLYNSDRPPAQRTPEKNKIILEEENESSSAEPSGKKNAMNSNKKNFESEENEQIETTAEEEVVYQLDEDGFLMDEKGDYILDDNGQMIKLTNEHIEYLRAADMLEEEVK